VYAPGCHCFSPANSHQAGTHAIVIAPELVRIEMLRIGHTYELAITRLWLSAILFRLCQKWQ
jgi:hypothetical protein